MSGDERARVSRDTRAVVVLDGGLLTTVQDLGRRGLGAIGVSPAGAVDWFAARAANRLVGNPDDAPLLETTLTGMAFAVRCDAAVAVTGADASLEIGGRRAALWRTWRLRAGERVVVGPASRGVRSYVAFDGGVDVVRVLGSASTDVGAGFGGRTLAAGDVLALAAVEGPSAGTPRDLELAPDAVGSLEPPATLRAMPGPDAVRLGAEVLDALCSTEYRAGVRSNRQAIRLEGAAIALHGARDAVTAGVCAGCVQVTGDGLPVVLLAEHQTTGGYLVALCVISADLSRAAQIRPGDRVRFARTDFGGARDALAEAAQRLRAMRPVLHSAPDLDAERLARGFFEGDDS